MHHQGRHVGERGRRGATCRRRRVLLLLLVAASLHLGYGLDAEESDGYDDVDDGYDGDDARVNGRMWMFEEEPYGALELGARQVPQVGLAVDEEAFVFLVLVDDLAAHLEEDDLVEENLRRDAVRPDEELPV